MRHVHLTCFTSFFRTYLKNHISFVGPPLWSLSCYLNSFYLDVKWSTINPFVIFALQTIIRKFTHISPLLSAENPSIEIQGEIWDRSQSISRRNLGRVTLSYITLLSDFGLFSQKDNSLFKILNNLHASQNNFFGVFWAVETHKISWRYCAQTAVEIS